MQSIFAEFVRHSQFSSDMLKINFTLIPTIIPHKRNEAKAYQDEQHESFDGHAKQIFPVHARASYLGHFYEKVIRSIVRNEEKKNWK